MNALASAINTKAGLSGAKDLDALKTVVDGLKIDSNDYTIIEGTLAAPFGGFENDADLIANGLYTCQMSAAIYIDISPLEMDITYAIMTAAMYLFNDKIVFSGVLNNGENWMSAYAEYDIYGALTSCVMIVDGNLYDVSPAASLLYTKLILLTHPVDESSELHFTLTSNLTQTLYITQSSGSAVEVDWGDESAEERSSDLAATFSHTYAEAGDYTVRIKCRISETWSPGFTDGNNRYGIIGKFTNKSDTYPTLTSFRFGMGARLNVGYAFTQCTGLTSVLLTDEITSIPTHAFYKCTSLTSVTIPDSVTSIGSYAFYSCNNLTSITISDSVTAIDENAFESCQKLANITIPDSVTTIGTAAFHECTSLMSAVIGSGITTIDRNVFYGCSGLTSATIGSGVTSIGDNMFYGCTNLISITCNATIPPTIKNATFNGTPDDCPIYVPADSVSLYQAAQYWSSRAAYIQAIPAS